MPVAEQLEDSNVRENASRKGPCQTLLLSVGTRPEIIKMAPVYQALRRLGAQPLLLHSGQHVEMAQPLYELFEMTPDHVITLSRSRSSLGDLNAELLARISQHVDEIRPDALLVHGDTSTALASALAGFYAQVPVGHVEAGLRTFNRHDPFPEESNRTLIARLAAWHFAPTARAHANLRSEGISAHVHVTGNTAVDAAHWGLQQLEASPRWSGLLAGCPLKLQGDSRLLLVTAHRRENWDGGIAQIARGVKDWLLAHPQYAAAWPVHMNPVVSQVVHDTFADVATQLQGRLWLCPPLDYMQLLALLSQCWLVLTDSGGIQEEAAALDRPVLVLRQTTERPEIVESGRAMLVGADARNIELHLQRLHDLPTAYLAMLQSPNPFGDGHAAERIAHILLQAQGEIAPPAPELASAAADRLRGETTPASALDISAV